jgi:hypothetical protein
MVVSLDLVSNRVAAARQAVAAIARPRPDARVKRVTFAAVQARP